MKLFNATAVGRVLGIEKSNFKKQREKPSESLVRDICDVIRVNPEWVLHGDPHPRFLDGQQKLPQGQLLSVIVTKEEAIRALLPPPSSLGAQTRGAADDIAPDSQP